jgi:hypothetical protein
MARKSMLMCTPYSGGAASGAAKILLVILIHFGFQRRQLLADFIVRFQFGKLLIQRLSLPKRWLSASASI